MSLSDRPTPRDVGAELRTSARRRAERWPAWMAPIVAMGIAAFSMALVIVLDYVLDQAEHRIFKVLAGLLALGAILSLPQFGLLLLPIATPFLPWIPPAPVPGLNPLNLLLFSIFGSFALSRMLKRQKVLRPGALGMWFGLFVLVAAVSIIRGSAFPTGLGYSGPDAALQLFRSTTSFAPYFIVLAMVRGESGRRRVTWAVILGLLAETLITLALGRNGSGLRAMGTLGQPNELGSFLALYAVVAVALLAGTRNLFGKLLLLTTVVLSTIGLLMSLSRGAMLALVISLGFVAWRTSRIFFGVVVAILLMSPLWIPDYVKERISGSQVQVEGSDEMTADGATEARVQTWRSILEVVQDHPIEGVGWTGLGYVLSDIGIELGLEDVKDSAHNTFMRILGEMGLIGISVFLGLLWRCWTICDEAARRARSGFDRALAIGVGGAVISMAVTSAFGDRFFNIIIATSFWILLALVEDSVLESRAVRA